jgi:hypothetical protein
MISRNRKVSQATIAVAMGWKLYSGEPHKTRASRTIDALAKDKLVKKTRNGLQITAEGKAALKGNTETDEEND